MTHRVTRQLLGWLALSAALTPRTFAQPDVKVLTAAIVGGHLTGNGAVSATALIDDCDATLVADDLLLTAAHCLGEGAPTQAWFGNSMEQAVITAPIAYCQAHPGYPETAGSDIAFCVLTESVTDIEPMLLEANCALDTKNVEQTDLTLRGHGYVTAARQEERVEREVEVHVDTVQADGRELVVGDREHGACNGDSGGTAYRTLGDGDAELVGVISRRGPAMDGTEGTNCESTTVVTRVAPHLAWIALTTGAVLSTTCDKANHSNYQRNGASLIEPFSDATVTTSGPTMTANAPTVTRTPAGCSLAPVAARGSMLSQAWILLALWALHRFARAGRHMVSPRRCPNREGERIARPS